MKVLRLIVVLLFIAVPLTAFAKKAKTIDELAKMYDVSSCKECHAKIYEEWEKSMHARSLFGTKRTMGGMKGMIEAGLFKAFGKLGATKVEDVKLEHFAQCFKCHAPHIMKDGTDELARQLAKAFVDADAATLKKVSINCIVCHNTKAIVHKWQDGEPEADVIYGTKDAEHPGGAIKEVPFKKIKKSAIIKEAVMCGQCHGLGPNLEFAQPSQCATAYGSYLHAYIPSGGSKTCQDCHMKDSKKGHQMPSYRDPDMAKMAVDVSVDILAYKFLLRAGDSIPMAVATVKILNKAGHRIPDG